MRRQTIQAGLSLALLMSFVFAPSNQAQTRPDARATKVGVPQSAFVDVPDVLVDVLKKQLHSLIEEFTGLHGRLVIEESPFDLARKMQAGEVQLGAFQGVEFAWVQSRHPGLRPLVVALNRNPNVQAQIVVRADSDIERFEDLKAKTFAYPMKNREHCRLFLGALCSKAAADDPKEFFGEFERPASAEKALDDLAAGKVHAVLADKAGIEFYARLKPGPFAEMKVLKTSAAFPAAVIAYHKGGLDEKRVEQVRSGLLTANKKARGKDLMASWGITSIAPVPDHYPRDLRAILKVHPVPETTALSK